MGANSDAEIAAWQAKVGIKPATGKYLERLDEVSEWAFELIKTIELEKSGIRDGRGVWCGSDALSDIRKGIGDQRHPARNPFRL
jgi:hypothetical protein